MLLRVEQTRILYGNIIPPNVRVAEVLEAVCSIRFGEALTAMRRQVLARNIQITGDSGGEVEGLRRYAVRGRVSQKLQVAEAWDRTVGERCVTFETKRPRHLVCMHSCKTPQDLHAGGQNQQKSSGCVCACARVCLRTRVWTL